MKKKTFFTCSCCGLFGLLLFLSGTGRTFAVTSGAAGDSLLLELVTEADEYVFTVDRKMEITIHHYQSGYKYTHLKLTSSVMEEHVYKEAYDSYSLTSDRNLTQACIRQILHPGSYRIQSKWMDYIPAGTPLPEKRTVIEGRAAAEENFIVTAPEDLEIARHHVPIDLGVFNSSFKITDTRDTRDYQNPPAYGIKRNGVYYLFETEVPMDISIDHRNSDINGLTVVRLDKLTWVENGFTVNNGEITDFSDDMTCMLEMNDGDDLGRSCLFKKGLAPGRYLVYSNGWYSPNTGNYTEGIITTRMEGSAITGSSFENPIRLGVQEQEFAIADTRSPLRYQYLSFDDSDAFSRYWYSLELSSISDLEVTIANGSFADTYICLLSEDKKPVPTCPEFETDDSWKWPGLLPGKYCIGITHPYWNESEPIHLFFNGSLPVLEANSIVDPVYIGEKSEDFTSVHEINTAYLSNTHRENDTENEVYFKLDLLVPMTVDISACQSPIATLLTLLDADLHILKISSSDCSLTVDSLHVGSYYIIAEGISENGLIPVEIQGNPLSNSNRVMLSGNRTNYVLGIRPKVRITDKDELKVENSLYSISYFDEYGRLSQQSRLYASPSGRDILSLQEYDPWGRDSKSWLPVSARKRGASVDRQDYRPISEAQYAGDTKSWSLPVYEPSPLNRISRQFGPGEDWQDKGKAVETAWQTNSTTDATLNCKLYKAGGTGRSPVLTQNGNYAAGQLYVTEIKDEDGNISYEFKDRQGQVVLTRQICDGQNHDTYYVYNSFGCKCFVLPPRIQEEGITPAKLNELAYQYRYDHRNRCIWKKLPGADPVCYVYDKIDQLIFTQDGEQRIRGEWTFSIPDAFGRNVLTGICTDTLNISNQTVKGVFEAGGIYKGYTVYADGTDRQFVTAPTILSASYYDSYDFRGMVEIPSADTEYIPRPDYGTWHAGDYSEANKDRNKGLLTGSLSARLNAGGAAGSLYSVMYYDSRGRLIQGQSSNHLEGIEEEYMAYNFMGQPVKKLHIHTGANNAPATRKQEEYTSSYDHAGRLLKTTHRLDSGPETILAENSYDELGRLQSVRKADSDPLTTEYTYNIRSWTKSISGPLFNQTLYYNEPTGRNRPQYGGNISAMEWSLPGEGRERGYNFEYDHLSRLISAGYFVNGNVSNHYSTSYSYDRHGNMLTAIRRGKTTLEGETYDLVDHLTMAYHGNQLLYVRDTGVTEKTSESADFIDCTGGSGLYTYNRNGSMNKDTHKGITEVRYNALNLPVSIEINNGSTKGRTKYVYSATGAKLRVTHETDMNGQHAAVMGTAPFSTEITETKITDYAGNKIYEDGVLKKIRVEGGYIDMETGEYHFYIQDYLGNNRVVAKADGTILQKNHYYPFGMAFAEPPGNSNQPYRYNGKELDRTHGLNVYDYSARFMIPDIGRFMMMDPLCEIYCWISPYAYCGNNPVRYKDPTGKWIVGTDGKPVTYTKGIWSSNASSDVRRIGNAMSLTKTGTKQLKSMLYKLDKISMSFSSEIIPEGKGIRVGNTRREARRGSDGSVKVTEEGHKIIIYDKAIEQNISQDAGNNPLKGLSMEEAIGVVATHESGHTEEENTTQSYENVQKSGSHDLEAHPTQLENNALQELEEQKQRIRQEIINLRRP